jgi:hypothetical protein
MEVKKYSGIKEENYFSSKTPIVKSHSNSYAINNLVKSISIKLKHMKKYITILFLLITVHVSAQIWETNEPKNRRKSLTTDEIVKMLLIFVVVGTAVYGVIYGIAGMQKGTSSMGKPRRILTFSTNTTIEKTMQIIIQYQNKYKIDDFNEVKFIIVLSDSPPFNPLVSTGYGFFYPIYLTKQNEGRIDIEVGIKGKLFQWGPIVSRNHEKCFNGIKAAVFANK